MEMCNIDHTLADVQKKLEEQSLLLPKPLIEAFTHYLQKDITQNQLNEAFHLLKKYDLLSDEEKAERNQRVREFLNK